MLDFVLPKPAALKFYQEVHLVFLRILVQVDYSTVIHFFFQFVLHNRFWASFITLFRNTMASEKTFFSRLLMDYWLRFLFIIMTIQDHKGGAIICIFGCPPFSQGAVVVSTK